MSLGPYSNQHITNQFNGKQTTTKSSVCCCPCDFLGVLSPVFLCSDKTTALSLRAPPGGQPSPLGHEGGSTCAESNDSSMKPTGLDLNFLQVQKSPPPKVPEVVFTVDKARLWKPSCGSYHW